VEELREIVFYKEHFIKFYLELNTKTQVKYEYVFVVVRQAERIPSKFFKKIKGTESLYEIRVEMNSNIYRTFCTLYENKFVVLFNSFQKKTQKTPKNQIEKALRILKEYNNEKD